MNTEHKEGLKSLLLMLFLLIQYQTLSQSAFKNTDQVPKAMIK